MATSVAHLIYVPAAVAVVAFATAGAHDRLDLEWSLAYVLAINAAAFVFYVYDKLVAKVRNALYLTFLPVRVPDVVLKWWLALPGGIVGAYAAMNVADHKTGDDEREFRIDLLKAYAIQVTAVALLLALLDRAMLTREQLDAVVAALAGTVVSTVQMFMTTVK